MPTATTPDLIGSADAGKILGKSARTIHRLVASGELAPALHIKTVGRAGMYLFRRADIEAIAELEESA